MVVSHVSCSLGSLPQDGSYSEADLVEALKEDDVISAFFAQLSSDFPEVNKFDYRGEYRHHSNKRTQVQYRTGHDYSYRHLRSLKSTVFKWTKGRRGREGDVCVRGSKDNIDYSYTVIKGIKSVHTSSLISDLNRHRNGERFQHSCVVWSTDKIADVPTARKSCRCHI